MRTLFCVVWWWNQKGLSRTEYRTIYPSSQVNILPNGQQNILCVTCFPFLLLDHSHLKQLLQLFTNYFRQTLRWSDPSSCPCSMNTEIHPHPGICQQQRPRLPHAKIPYGLEGRALVWEAGKGKRMQAPASWAKPEALAVRKSHSWVALWGLFPTSPHSEALHFLFFTPQCMMWLSVPGSCEKKQKAGKTTAGG